MIYKAETQNKIALDLGIKTYASLFDETVILNPTFLVQSEAKIKELQSALSYGYKNSEEKVSPSENGLVQIVMLPMTKTTTQLKTF